MVFSWSETVGKVSDTISDEYCLGTTSKPNRRLTSGSVRFWAVSIVLDNDNRPEPAVGWQLGSEAAPYITLGD